MVSIQLKTWWVYAFTEPVTQAVKYVGCCRDPYERLKCHMCATNINNPLLADWIKQLRKKRTMPGIIILERVPFRGPNRGDRERYWVEFYHDQGAGLFNKQLNPSFVPPPVDPLNGNTHSGQIRRAFEKLGWDAPAELIQKEVGPRDHHFDNKNCRWNGWRWEVVSHRKYLLPLSYINKVRNDGPKYTPAIEGT